MSALTIPPSDIRCADGSHEWWEQDGFPAAFELNGQGDTIGVSAETQV
jgi:hypothetical protein